MSDEIDLEALAVRADAGDPAAAAELVAATSGVLIGVARRLVAVQPALDGRVSTSDVVQSVYRWFFTERDKTRPPVENVLGLLIDMARRRVRHQSVYHGRKRRNRHKEVADMQDGLVASGRTPFSAAAHAEDIARLVAAVGRFTDKQRELLDRVSAGERFDDLAVDFGVSAKTLRRWHKDLCDRLLVTLAGTQ